MLTRLKALLRRVDMLLLGLTLLTSWVLVEHYGVSAEDSMVEVASHSYPMAAEAAEPEPLPAPARAAAPVRFLMYNVQNYFVEADTPRSRHPRRIKTIRERELTADVIAAQQPEVVGLIEIGGPEALDDLAKRLAERRLNYPHRKVLTRWGEDRALAILSMHPIVEDHSKADCPLLGQTNRMMLRGILDVTIQAKDKRRFRILGTHLKSRVGDNPGAAQALRAREARTLANHVQQILRKQPATPLLVYGDWNDGPKDAALAVMTQGSSRATTLHRLKPEDENGECWTIFYKEGNEYNTFDQIYVSDALYKRMGTKGKKGIVGDVGGKKRSSDHRAVWCDLH